MKKIISACLAFFMGVLCFTACSVSVPSKSSSLTPIARGTVNGNVYQSSFTGLTVTLPDGWFVSDDAAIEQIMGLEAGTLTDSKDASQYSKAALTAQGIYDLLATNKSTGTTLAVCIEDLEIISDSADTTVEGYLDILRSKLDHEEITCYYGDQTVTTLCGNEYMVLPFSYESPSGTSKQIYCVRKVDNFIITVRMISLYNMEVTELEAFFA